MAQMAYKVTSIPFMSIVLSCEHLLLDTGL